MCKKNAHFGALNLSYKTSVKLEDIDVDFVLQHFKLCLFYLFFFHSFIGFSSYIIQYKFIMQHKRKKKKEKEKKNKKQNPKGVGAMGLTSHARHRP